MRNKRVIIYFTHKESLGHVSRVLNIIEAIKREKGPGVKIFVFQAGKRQKYLPVPDGVTWFDLPHPYYSKANFKRGATSRIIPLSAQIRAKFMLSKIKEIQPDIFITEFFPFGREDSRFELLPVLEFLRKNKVRICSSIGYPYLVQGNFKILSFYSSYYDRILIHTPQNLEYDYFYARIENPVLKAVYSKVFRILSDKIYYTGYLLPQSFLCPETGKRLAMSKKAGFGKAGSKLVVVSRGGGVIYPKIIFQAILASRILPAAYKFIVVSGPSSSPKEVSLFRKMIGQGREGQVEFYKYYPNLPQLIKDCDVSVSMCGYNTAVQLLYCRRSSVLIPSSVDPEIAAGYCSEQLSRADVLKDYLQSTVLDYNDLSAEEMAKGILKQAKRKSCGKKVGEKWFSGDINTVKAVFD